MIKLIDANIAFGDQAILDSASWMLGENDRVGLVGANGSGKTTLLKIMAGLQDFDRGKVETSKGLKIGYLPQSDINHVGHTLRQEARLALPGALELEAEKKRIERKLSEPGLAERERDELVLRLAEVMDRFALEDGYELDAKVGKVLSGLGFHEDEFDRPVETFSGGWQMRIALAKLLLQAPDVLLLDEPTNHLDLEARNWLEEFLRDYHSSFLIVSHDRYFLDITIERIVEIERGRLTDYKGGYSTYLVQKEKRVELARIAFERQEEEIYRLKAFINKYKADKKRAGQVQSRAKRIEKTVLVEAPIAVKPVHFKFPEPPRGPLEVARLRGVHKAYGERRVLAGVDLVVTRGEKIAVVGINGAGKSTLLSILAGRNRPDQGEREQGDGVWQAYFGQDAGEDLDPGDTVLQSIEKGAPFDMYPRLRNLLGAFLFSGQDADKKVSVLSGGEKSRLALARLLLRPANLLILDEPTNHLDLRAKEVLMAAFKAFVGALIFVAHDRYFLEDLPDRVVEVKDGKLANYPGDYTDYLHAKEREALAAADPATAQRYAPAATRDSRPAVAPAANPAGADPRNKEKEERLRRREEEKERSKRDRTRQNRLKKIETDITAHDQRQAEVEREMADSRVASNYMKLMDLELERKRIVAKVAELMKEWERLSLELEAAGR